MPWVGHTAIVVVLLGVLPPDEDEDDVGAGAGVVAVWRRVRAVAGPATGDRGSSMATGRRPSTRAFQSGADNKDIKKVNARRRSSRV